MAALFQRTKQRWLGRDHGPKTITVGAKPVGTRDDLTLGGVFDASSRTEGFSPNEGLRGSLERVASSYLDAYQAKAQAQTVAAVQSFLQDAELGGTKTDVPTVLGGELAGVYGKLATDLKRLFATETHRAAQAGTLDAVTKVAALAGQKDPTVCWVGPNDQHTCDECQRLYFLSDGVTPKAYKLSEASSGYHKRGASAPPVAGCHPHCRHSMVYIASGYGFDASGKLTYIGPDYDVLAAQRGA